MQLLLDECCAHRGLVKDLRTRGYDVERSIDLVGMGAADALVFSAAIREHRILVTSNCDDFIQLALNSDHPGLLLLYPDVSGSSHPWSAIAAAIVNVWHSYGEDAAALRGERIALNHYMW